MPELEETKHDLIDVGEEQGAEINFDENNEPEKQEVVVEEEIQVEKVEEPVEAKKEVVETAPKDELAEYSEGVQKRISKLTRKMREAERQKEEAVAFAIATKQQKEEIENRFSKLDQSYVSEFEKRVTTNMDSARIALKNAIESGNVDAQVTAQEQIAFLTSDAARLGGLKNRLQETKEREVRITPQQTQEVNNYQGYNLPRNAPTDSKAEAWASKNPWFGNDTAMTYTSFDLHKKLVEQEGYDPQSDEYYEEIDSRIRLEFPHKFDKVEGTSTERAKPAQNVASAKRSASTGRSRKTVKLSPSQVAIAKRLGVPLEDYAKQKQLTEGN
jgi:hypothetical protein